MANPYSSIMVVDDARFSTTVITKTLQHGGYQNIRRTASAEEALLLQQSDPASIMIVDWMMPDMDGLELTRKLRQLDEASNRYTYVIMLTAKDGPEALNRAFDEGVDDFVNKAVMQEQLLARVYAAERLVDNQNRLLTDYKTLVDANRDLQQLCTIDPLTGLGNQNYCMQHLKDALAHSTSRGGAVSLLVFEIEEFVSLRRQFPKHVLDEIITGVSKRVRHGLRPLDTVCRIDDRKFCAILQHPDISHATPGPFRRLQDAVNHKAFKTSMGYQTIKLTISMLANNGAANAASPDADTFINQAIAGLQDARETGRIAIKYYQH